MLLHYIFSWIRRFQWAAVVGVLLWAPAGLAASGPNLPRSERSQILATIKPLTLIARDVAGDLAEVRQLLPDGASPHEYALRVSDRRLLGAADVVLWVGPVLEPYLNNAVAGMVPGRVLTAADLPGIVWPESSSDKTGVEQGRDEHLWLDPRNARIIARALGQALVARSPDTAAAVTDRDRKSVV